MGIKIQQTSTDILLNHTLIYSNKDVNANRYKVKRCYLPKGITKNYVIINGKNFYDQLINSDIRLYEEMQKKL